MAPRSTLRYLIIIIRTILMLTLILLQGLLDHVTVLIGIAVGSKAVAGIIHQPYYNYKSEGATVGRTFYGLLGEEKSKVERTSHYKGYIKALVSMV